MDPQGYRLDENISILTFLLITCFFFMAASYWRRTSFKDIWSSQSEWCCQRSFICAPHQQKMTKAWSSGWFQRCLVITPETWGRSTSWQRWTAKKQLACCCGSGAMNIYLKVFIFGGRHFNLLRCTPEISNNHCDPIHHQRALNSFSLCTHRWGQDPRTCDVLWIRLTSATGNATSKTKWMESLFG